MKIRATIIAVVSTLVAGTATVASADTERAICEFYNHGEMKKDRTGPCAVEKDDGEIEITLYKGKVYTFKPEEKRKNRYIDQDGNRAAEEKDADWKYTYKWKNQRLIVMYPGD